MGTIYKVNEEVYTASILENIDLSTPDVISAQISNPPAPEPNKARAPRRAKTANDSGEPKTS